ncbi:MAG: site-2 protease family protein [Bryobacteraceae bacterium]
MYPSTASGALGEPLQFPRIVVKQRLALHITLLVLTLLTATVVGSGLGISFYGNLPLTLDTFWNTLLRLPAEPSLLWIGLPYSLTLLGILFAHEMGHYLACRRYGIDATLPYFLPFPSLLGTLGAFIRIRSPIYTRRALFDVGVAGPIAGFVTLLPAAVIGVALSRVGHGAGLQGDWVFSTPLLLRGVEALLFPHVSPQDIYLHPVARAAWAGLLATALNLIPIGQLDGGHIVYAFFGRWHKPLSRVLIVGLVAMGYVADSWIWWVWAALLLFALRHPVICDESELGSTRVKLGWAALLILILSFTPVPVREREPAGRDTRRQPRSCCARAVSLVIEDAATATLPTILRRAGPRRSRQPELPGPFRPSASPRQRFARSRSNCQPEPSREDLPASTARA